MKYQTKVFLIGNNAGITVPTDIIEKLNGGKRPAVKISINGYEYHTSVAPMSGEFRIPISAAHRAGAGVAGNDLVTVYIELDTAPREVDVPAELAAAFKTNTKAKEFFDKLSYSHKRSYTEWIAEAKKDETRQARIAKAIDMLQTGQKR